MKRTTTHPSFNCLRLSATVAICVLGLSVWPALAETEENLDKTFTASPGGQLVVEVEFGAIEVTSNAGDQVSIQVMRRVTRASKEDEQSFLEERPVTIAQEGATITVRSKGPSLRSSSKGKQRTEARYTISVPGQFNARLKTAGGAIAVSDLKGECDAQTSGGPLKFARLRGPLDGQTAGGAIHVNDCEGTLKIKTSGGGIEVSGGGGALDGRTAGGTVKVESFKGPVRVETTGGGIHLNDVAGKVEGSTSGGSISASFSSLSDSVKLETSGGSVTLHAPSDAAFDLDASTSGGSASSELPVTITGKKSRDHLRGPVNGGGKTVVLRSSGGGVQVKKL